MTDESVRQRPARRLGMRVLSTLPMALWLALTTTVYAAVTLYCANADEFWFSLAQGLQGVWAAGGVVAAAALLALCLVPERARRATLAVALALGLSLLLQMTLLNADYGQLDGKAIDWGSYTVYGIINTATWAALLVICLAMRRAEWFGRLAVILPVALMLAEGATAWRRASALPVRTASTLPLEMTSAGLDTVGRDNLLLLILDSTDADDLAQALSDDPSLAQTLDGFTFYQNALGLSDPTKYGLPAILTGRVHDQPVSYDDFLADAYRNAPLFTELQRQGYDARVFTDSRYFDMSAVSIGNGERKTVTVSDQRGLTRDLLRLCAFGYAPHFLKPELWMYSNVFGQYMAARGTPLYQQNDPAYAQTLREQGLRQRGGKALRVIHLVGMHPPYTMDAQGRYVESGTDEKQQMAGLMGIVGDYLAELKRLGVYDASDVLILADHGTETVQRPLLLLKRKGERGSLRTSAAPVSYADLNATYMALLGAQTDGTPLWAVPTGKERTRYYYHESSTNNLFSLYQYETTLDAPAFADLVKTGEVYHADTGGAPAPYTLGTTLYFDLRATARPYEVSGFSSADHASTWTSGDTGEFRLPLAALPAGDSVTVHMTYLSVMQGSQTLIVTCGGQEVYHDVVTGEQIAFAVPAKLIGDGALDLRFAYPDAISHKDAGISDDTRKVAFALTSITVDDAPAAP